MKTTTVRVLLSLTALLAAAWLASCGHYTCGTTFGNSTCTPGTPGIGGPGNPSSSALIYYVATGALGGFQFDGSSKAFAAIPNFVSPTLPSVYAGSDIAIANKKFIYVPYVSTGELYGWSINSAGALTPLTGSPFSAPWASGLASATQPLNSIIVSPDGKYLYVADAADNEIEAFQIDPSTGALTAVPGSPFSTVSTGVQPWNLATDGLGKFLYINESDLKCGGIDTAVFTINASTGALSGGTDLQIPMFQVAGEPTGKFMIGTRCLTGSQSNGGLIDANLHVFSINQASGVLTETPTSPVPTNNGPIRVVVHPSGKYVYDFNINSATNFDGPLDGFQLDTTTGALTPITGSPFSALSLAYGGVIDQTGAYMFFHSHGHVGVWTLDTTTGVPTELTSGQNGISDFPWAVTDGQ